MGTTNRAQELAERFLGAWNAQDVDKVVGCYTADLKYRDPNTRGDVEGEAAMRKYLTKLFGKWRMTWTHRESFPLAGAGEEGYAVLWHARFQKPEGGLVVEADGMDLVVMRGDRIARNEVYFDRAVLAPFMG